VAVEERMHAFEVVVQPRELLGQGFDQGAGCLPADAGRVYRVDPACDLCGDATYH
jgi:hypothetical protein